MNRHDDAILEKYGLEHIFAINENGISNIFEKFKKPLQDTLNKIKNKFGDKPNKFIVNIIKRASAKGEKNIIFNTHYINIINRNITNECKNNYTI